MSFCIRFHAVDPNLSHETLLSELTALHLDPTEVVFAPEAGGEMTCYKTSHTEAERCLELLRRSPVFASVRLEAVDAGWKTKWRDGIEAFALTERLWVAPAWKDECASAGRDTLLIDTELAFGLGNHPTTRFIAQWIEQNRGEFASFLDIGTGTGILALVAAKYDAKRIDVIDTSAEAIRVAEANAQRNGCVFENALCVSIEQFKPKQPYAFVAANLLSDDLLKNRTAILNCVASGGLLAVSGVSTENAKKFKASFPGAELSILSERQDGGWVGVLLRAA